MASKPQIKLGVADCEGCPALCCSDLEESILRPVTNEEVDNLKWELHFENTRAFIRANRWYTLTLGRCMYLGDDDLCAIYDKRPETCREHNPPECERFGSIYDVMFETPNDLEKYIRKEKKRRKQRKLKNRQKKKILK